MPSNQRQPAHFLQPQALSGSLWNSTGVCTFTAKRLCCSICFCKKMFRLVHLTAVEAQPDRILSPQSLILPSSVPLPLRDCPHPLFRCIACITGAEANSSNGHGSVASWLSTTQTPTSEKSGGVKVSHPKTALCVRGDLWIYTALHFFSGFGISRNKSCLGLLANFSAFFKL